MSKTEVSGKQLKDGSVELVDLAPEVSGVLDTLQSDVATLQTDVAAKADAGNLASVATSGSYNDLSDKPSIPSVAGLASETYVDTAVAGKADSASLASVATSGSYNDLADKPSIPSVAGLASETYVDTAVAAVVNSAPATLDTLKELSDALGADENFATTVAGQIGDVASDVSALDVRVTSLEGDLNTLQSASAPNLSQLGGVAITSPSSGQVLKYDGLGWVNAADSTFSGAYADLTGKPSLFSGSYTDLTSKPTLFDGAYSSLTGKPTLATVATSGSYNDLTNKPTIPASLDDLSDVVITSASKGQFVVHNGTSFVNSSTIEASDAAVKPLIVKGAASQSANLLEVQNNTGTSLLSVSNIGTITSGMFSTYAGGGLGVTGIGSGNSSYSAQGVYLNASVSAYGVMDMVGNNGGFIDFAAANEDYHGRLLYDRGSHAYYFYTGANATAKVYIDRDNYGTLWVGPGSASSKGVVVQAAASQTANLFEAQNSSGTVLFSVDKDGSMAAGTVPVARVSGLATVATSGSYNDLTNKPAAGASDLDGLSDVVITSAAKGHFIAHNGTNFVNTRIIEADVAATVPMTLKGAASQSGNFLQVQNSSSQILNKIGSDGSVSMYDSAGANGYTVSNSTGNEKHTLASQKAFQITQPGVYGTATTFSIGADDTLDEKGKWQIRYGTSGSSGAFVNFRPGYQDSNRFGGVGIMVPDDMYVKARLHIHNVPFPTQSNYGDFTGLLIQNYDNQSGTNAFEIQNHSNVKQFAINKQGQVQAVSAATKALVVKGAASQTANLFEVQNSAGTALATIASDGTLHTARYTETVANAFNTSLAPSTGTLTVNTALGNAVLGALSAAVTTWAFTNVPTDNSKVTTVTAVIAGNASYTYGDACSVNGSAVSGGIMWSGGSAPTATAGTDIITFIIVKDSAGTVKVFGSATTNFS